MESPIPPDECWDLRHLFPDEEEFGRSRAAITAAGRRLERWRGRLGESATVLAEALGEITSVHEGLAKLRCYASLRSDRDTRNPVWQTTREEVDLLSHEISRRTAYLRPEILALDAALLERFVEEEPGLGPFRFFLRDLMRQRAHVLGPAEEQILSSSGMISGTPPALFEMLNNVELPRPEIVLDDGKRVRLTPVEFQRLRASEHRPDRLRAFPAYYGAYGALRETLGLNLFGTVKAHLFHSAARSYPDCLAAALDGDNVPVAVYRNLIAQVRARLGTLHRYFRLRARALGLDTLEYPDLYCPLGRQEAAKFSPPEARRMVEESLAPLGSEYADALRLAYRGHWIDWHPAPGKRSGAYVNGSAYAVHPYVLLNYTGDLESVSTLTHELGHALHSHFSNLRQPYATADYSIFVAEVASTLNEVLLQERLRATAGGPEQRRFLLGSFLDGVRGTLFRQTMFAEFELRVHELAEAGQAPSGAALSELYLELLRTYHGHDLGVMHIADDYAVEWAAIPHFHYGFYVYQYATGIVAAMALAEGILAEGPSAARTYLDFLAAGGSDYPLELLRRAGVDLQGEAPYAAAFAAVERGIDDLEAALSTAATC